MARASNWLNDLAAYLQAHSLGTVGTNLYKGRFPTDFPPGTLGIALTPTQGLQADRQHELEYPRVQITCRHSDYPTAWNRAHEIYAKLDDPDPFSQGSTAFFAVRALQAPFSLGVDERDAWRIVANYQLDVLST